MATQNEKNAVLELIDLAMAVNDQGAVNVSVDTKGWGVEMRVTPIAFDGTWIYYPDQPAYFSDNVFTEEQFLERVNGFIAEAKKHHKSFDADGVKL